MVDLFILDNYKLYYYRTVLTIACIYYLVIIDADYDTGRHVRQGEHRK